MDCDKRGVEHVEEGSQVCEKYEAENVYADEIKDNEHKKLQKAWSPRAIKYITYICSIIPGSILFSLNYIRLNHPKKKSRILTIVGVAILYIILNVKLPRIPLVNYMFYFGSLTFAMYFCSDQKDLFKKHMESGGKKASIIIPLILSIMILLIFFLLLIFSEK